ncbi:phosphotransferase enzyme family protein [Kaarinaea lacus]
MKKAKYTYSQLSSESAGNLVNIHYDLPGTNRCKFYVLGLHDNYLIESDDNKYILRIYRNDWRSQDEILYELELLAFLDSHKASVAGPVATKTGGLCFFIDSPEGNRAGALFSYAPGVAPGSAISAGESTILGETVARVHNKTEAFETTYTRTVLDIPYLLDESICAIEPFLESAERSYLRKFQTDVKESLPVLPREAPFFGICIGDVNLSNFHIDSKNAITLFDFDQCGYGYRAFEIGKFFSSLQSIAAKQEIAQAFIDGYQLVRKLSQEELLAIPFFEKIAVIWVMAIHVYNANRIGYKQLEKPFWDRRLAILKELDKEQQYNK